MEEKLKISHRFDLDDIRAIRNYDAEKYKDKTPSEVVMYTKEAAESVLSLLDKSKITFVKLKN